MSFGEEKIFLFKISKLYEYKVLIKNKNLWIILLIKKYYCVETLFKMI